MYCNRVHVFIGKRMQTRRKHCFLKAHIIVIISVCFYVWWFVWFAFVYWINRNCNGVPLFCMCKCMLTRRNRFLLHQSSYLCNNWWLPLLLTRCCFLIASWIIRKSSGGHLFMSKCMQTRGCFSKVAYLQSYVLASTLTEI